jgi:hypothetical protein
MATPPVPVRGAPAPAPAAEKIQEASAAKAAAIDNPSAAKTAAPVGDGNVVVKSGSMDGVPVSELDSSGRAFVERRVRVDPDVAYYSGLCTRCEPTRPPAWESGPIMWIQVAFAFLFAIVIVLLIVGTVLCVDYVRKHRHRTHHP